MGDLDAPPDDEPGIVYWEQLGAHREGDNTHLWIVNRAVDILARHRDEPAAAAAYDRLSDRQCRDRWEQGLYDADYRAPYHDGYFDLDADSSTWTIFWSGATWESHFYDPDSGENYRGRTSPVARTRAATYAAQAWSAFARGDDASGCYRLGLSLHYMTDLTQPMHAANYAATDWPLKLHSSLEGYAVDVQDRYARPDWSGPPEVSADAIVVATAREAKAMWPTLYGAVAASYDARSHCDDIDAYYWDHADCWDGDRAVDAAVGQTLWNAQSATARYLAALELPAP